MPRRRQVQRRVGCRASTAGQGRAQPAADIQVPARLPKCRGGGTRTDTPKHEQQPIYDNAFLVAAFPRELERPRVLLPRVATRPTVYLARTLVP